MTRRLAALDIGSNTIHLLVAEADESGALVDVDHDLTMPRIGKAVQAGGSVGDEKLAEVCDAVSRFAARARELGAEVLLVGATEAVRKAADAERVLEEVGRAAGVPCTLISPDVEARLSFRGATSAGGGAGVTLVTDIGGGSTECVIGEGGAVEALASVPVGSGVVTERWLRSDPPTAAEREACASGVREALAAAPQGSPVRGIAVGGTATTLPCVLDLPEGDGELDAIAIVEIRRRLGENPSAEIAARHRIDPVRARVLPGGLELLAAVLERYGLDAVTTSLRGLRHGMILAFVEHGDLWSSG
jgi:exopolyphosphatase / guanosine-5'-triphosphate,3'-diphosphate pyrophosphatase